MEQFSKLLATVLLPLISPNEPMEMDTSSLSEMEVVSELIFLKGINQLNQMKFHLSSSKMVAKW